MQRRARLVLLGGRLSSTGLERLQRWFGLCCFQRNAEFFPFGETQGQNDNSYSFSAVQNLGCYRQFFFKALLLEQAGVVTVAGDELVVSAEFGDAAGDEDGDLVGVAGGGDAVRDEDSGAAFHVSLEAAEDSLFCVGVDAG